MTDDIQKKIDEARERGKFEGEVLTSLADIKRVLDDMKNKHAAQDIELGKKADKEEVENLKKQVYLISGAATATATILSKLLS